MLTTKRRTTRLRPKKRDVKLREDIFLEHYLKHFRIGEAAVAAGYSKKSADRIGGRLLSKPEVKKAVEQALAKRAEKAELDADWVLSRLIKVVERCMQAEEMLDRKGRPTGIYRFDSKGANRALELIGKHIGMFRDGRLGDAQSTPQQHLHVHVGPDGKPILQPAGQVGQIPGHAGFLPPIREVIVNRPKPEEVTVVEEVHSVEASP